MRGDEPADRARAVEEVALALAIPHLLDRTVDTLSGGELQRVALAAALVTRPRLILLDEPTSQLDPVAGDELIWLLRRLNEEWGVAVLLAEHRLERCLAAADRVVAMEVGRASPSTAPLPTSSPGRSDADPALETPAARLFSLAGIDPLPVGVRDARQTLRGMGVAHPPQPLQVGGCRDPQSPSDPALEAEEPVGRAGPGRRPAGRTQGHRADDPPRRTRRADGTQRRREEHAAADRGRAARACRREDRASTRSRSSPRTPATTWSASGSATSCPGDEGMAALRVVGLEHTVDADPRDLSGGERQRLALAIALAGRMEGEQLPGVVALDEPTRGMDHARKDELVALIARLAGDVDFVAMGPQSRRRRGGRRRHPRRRVRLRSSPSASSCSATGS